MNLINHISISQPLVQKNPYNNFLSREILMNGKENTTNEQSAAQGDYCSTANSRTGMFAIFREVLACFAVYQSFPYIFHDFWRDTGRKTLQKGWGWGVRVFQNP
jgi:hypothetical protein